MVDIKDESLLRGLEQKHAPYEVFYEVVLSLCNKITKHPDFFADGRRGIFAPLSGTDWADRSSEWFPKDPIGLPSLRMSQHSYDSIESCLLRPKDNQGQRIVNDSDVARLRSGYEQYRTQVCVAPKGARLDFFKMLQSFDSRVTIEELRDCDGFKSFLFRNVYADVIGGRAAQAQKKALLLYSATASKGENSIASSEEIRVLQKQACIALLGYIGYLAEDASEHQYVRRMAESHRRSSSIFFEARLLAHSGHHTPGSKSHIQVLRMVLGGCPVEIPTYERVHSSSYHNAVRSCLERGMLLDQKIPGCGSLTLSEAIEEGMIQHQKFGDNDSLLRHEILKIRGYLNAGQFQNALQKGIELRKVIMLKEADGEHLPHVKIRIILETALVYEALARKGEANLLEAAIHSTLDAVETAERYGLLITKKRLSIKLERLQAM